jgi:hypothetical protein
MITQKELLENLLYDKDTGVFTRKISLNTKVKVGDVAGGKDTKGYVCIRVVGKTYKAHRLAWLYVYGNIPIAEIDHINGIKDDNRIANLRDVTKSVNQQNRRFVKGYSKDGNRWKAQIRFGGKWKHLGCYETEQQAHVAYLSAKTKVHMKAREA